MIERLARKPRVRDDLSADEIDTLRRIVGEIADICGLTPVHVNRVLQEPRGRGLVRSDPPAIIILDWRGLADVGQFDTTYLNICKEAR